MVAEFKIDSFVEVIVEQLVPAPIVIVNREDQFGLAVVVVVPGIYQPHV